MPNNKNTENGRLYFGDKDAKYLEKVSRQAVEDHHNSSILFFEIDWTKSKRNFYGEMIIKKLKNITGVELRGVYNFTQTAATQSQGIPNKGLKLVVSIYTAQLKEVNVAPSLGDYFGIGKRLYKITDKTIEDVGPGNLMVNRGRVRQDFTCTEESDESLQKSAYGDNLGLEIDIKPGHSIID